MLDQERSYSFKPYRDSPESTLYTDGKQYFMYKNSYIEAFGKNQVLTVANNDSYDYKKHQLGIFDQNGNVLGLIMPVLVPEAIYNPSLRDENENLRYQGLKDILPLDVPYKTHYQQLKEQLEAGEINDPYIGHEYSDGYKTYIVTGLQSNYKEGGDFYEVSTLDTSNGSILNPTRLFPTDQMQNHINLWEENRETAEKQKVTQAVKDQLEAERTAIYNNTHGYADNMSPMQKSRVLEALDKTINTHEYGNLSTKDFIEVALRDGKNLETTALLKKKYHNMNANEYLAELNGRAGFDFQKMQDYKEAYSQYNQARLDTFRDNNPESPANEWLKSQHPLLHYFLNKDNSILTREHTTTEYRLMLDDSRFYNITKTAYDYGNYLLDNVISKEVGVSTEPEIQTVINEISANKINNNNKTQEEELLWEDEQDEAEFTKQNNTITDHNNISNTTENPETSNFIIKDTTSIGMDVGGTSKAKFFQNLEAIRTLKEIENDGRSATSDEQAILAKYSGFGGIPQAFDENNQQWSKEYQQLKDITTTTEYESLGASVLTSHYTPKEVIDAMYKGLERIGFKGGAVLEPSMGVGHFFGAMPNELSENSRFYGVELDDLTGRIAKHLYPNANIQISGFEESNTPDNFFDVAVGNVPFGDYSVHDPKFNKHNFLIHDYFLGKSLDKVRAGGVVAFVTSSGTMDKQNSSARKYIAERAELLGAIRLPNTAFKQGAGASITTDILFLKKREGVVDASNEDWVHVGKYDTKEAHPNGYEETINIPLNNYYISNPDMMLGEMKEISGRFGNETALLPNSTPLEELLSEAVTKLPKDVMRDYITLDDLENTKKAEGNIPADPNVKNYTFTLVDGKPFYRQDHIMTPVELKGKGEERLIGMIGLRNQVRNLIDLQLAECSDKQLSEAQRELTKTYDAFFKKFKSVNIGDNKKIFSNDSDYALVSSLEIINENNKTISKADIFTKRTIVPYKPIESVETSQEALAVSLYEKGKVDIGHMQKLTGKSYMEVVEELRGLIFKNPLSDSLEMETDVNNENILYKNWETADEYLSGKVVDKLEYAKAELESENANFPTIAGINLKELYSQNISALEAVQPIPLQAHEINVNIGASWIDPKFYRQFLIETLNPSSYQRDNINVSYSDITNSWLVGKSSMGSNRSNSSIRSNWSYGSVEATQTYGTKKMNAYELMEKMLNGQRVEIKKTITDADGRDKRVLDKDETIAIKDKETALNEAFKRWIFDDPTRREELLEKYNKMHNSERTREYDGSFLRFSGMNPTITLKKHQQDAVARSLLGGNTLLAHCVGAGKTYTMIATGMEMRRLGIANKPCYVVPNHISNQWTNEFRELYPAANILTTTKSSYTKAERKLFMAKIATGDWDAIILPQSFFERIPVSKERQQAKLQAEKAQAREYLEQMKSEGKNDWSRKQIEKTITKLDAKLKKLQDSPKDDLITFEDTGIDALFVDEAHYYKNKNIFSKRSRISGLVLNSDTQRVKDMEMKVEYVNEVNYGEKNVTMATGTPVSNSMAELYTMQSYLQPSKLKEIGHHHFDNWAVDYGRIVSQVELAPDGQSFRTKERFSPFDNVPRMMNTFRMVADIKTPEMLNLPIPELKGGKPTIVDVEASESQKELVKGLVSAADLIQQRVLKPEVYNMLVVTHHGSLGALDMRTIDVNAFRKLEAACNAENETLGIDFDKLKSNDTPNSKVNTCIDKVFDIYKKTETDKLTQMIFCDRATPKGDASFSVYNDIKTKLINKGVPENEIAFIHDAKTNAQKEKIFSKMRTGEIRVLIGSTHKMGTGTNAQRLLVALHNLDAPWRPSDLEQRGGRILRQGNLNKEVEIFNYVTKGTFDAYLWQIIEGKQKFISQVMSGKINANSIDEPDMLVLNHAEAKAIATGNPAIRRKLELEMEIGRLKVLERQHMAQRYQNQDRIAKTLPNQITINEKQIQDISKDIILRDKHHNTTFSMKLGTKDFIGSDSKKDAGELIIKAVHNGKHADKSIGTYRGFEIIPSVLNNLTNPKIILKGSTRYYVELGESGLGAITRIDNALANLNQNHQVSTEQLEGLKQQLESTKVVVNAPFEYAPQLEELQKELTAIDAELNIGKENHSDIIEELEDSGEAITAGVEQYEEEDEIEEDLEM